MTNNVLVIKDSEWDTEVQQSEKPVLVYFWASWCGPCKLVAPSVEKVAGDYGDRLKVIKMEIDPNPESVKKSKVEGVPALRFLKNGQIVASHEGAITKDKLAGFIEANLS
ncbi:MAG: thioredoxin family protein [Cyanobacteriota bacterium]|nr:thioredoxin family protein [Cyanobacteriota bacterium]